MCSQRPAQQTSQTLQESPRNRDLPKLYRQGESDDAEMMVEKDSIGIVRVADSSLLQSLHVLSAQGRVAGEEARSYALCICLQVFGMLGVPITLDRLIWFRFFINGEMLIGRF